MLAKSIQDGVLICVLRRFPRIYFLFHVRSKYRTDPFLAEKRHVPFFENTVH